MYSLIFRFSAKKRKKIETWDLESDSYRSIHVRRNAEMWNDTFKDHRIEHPFCQGFLHWDMNAEEMRGICSRQQMICDTCSYRSKKFNLYEEQVTGKAGRRAATQNTGLCVGLSKTPIAANSLRRICLSSNMGAPSARGLQKTTNRIMSSIVEENKLDLQTQRRNLVQEQLKTGKVNAQDIEMQADALYNNPLYSGVGKTPFQPATQVVFSVAENVTANHNIIGLTVHNKLCSKGAHLKPKKSHRCSHDDCFVTLPFEHSIGDEKKWAKETLNDMKEKSGIQVNVLTTDGDCATGLAAQELFEEGKTSTQPKLQLDTAHVSRNHRKHIRHHRGLENKIVGPTIKFRQHAQSRLALDLSDRCNTELRLCRKKYPNNFLVVKRKISFAVDSIINCYQNDHSLCKKHSFVCQATARDNWLKKSKSLRQDFKLEESKETSDILRELINYRLSPAMLDRTESDSNTQKVESFNRALRTSLPRNVTFTRNVFGRAHSVCHSINKGASSSIKALCNRTGSPIKKGSKVDQSLTRDEEMTAKRRKYMRSSKAKRSRMETRKKVYDLYEQHQEVVKYQKQSDIPSTSGVQCEKTIVQQEHSYVKYSGGKRVNVRK